jgi:hypothetical protein
MILGVNLKLVKHVEGIFSGFTAMPALLYGSELYGVKYFAGHVVSSDNASDLYL